MSMVKVVGESKEIQYLIIKLEIKERVSIKAFLFYRVLECI